MEVGCHYFSVSQAIQRVRLPISQYSFSHAIRSPFSVSHSDLLFSTSVCSSFSCSLCYKVRLFGSFVFIYLFFLMEGVVRINFPLELLFTASLMFCYVVLPFSFLSRYFLIPLLISSLTHWLFRVIF